MPLLSWPDAFLGTITGVGGIVATAVTIVKLKASNPPMQQFPPNLIDDIAKLSDSQVKILITLERLDAQAVHYKETLVELKESCKEDHMHIKLLHDWMVQFLSQNKHESMVPLEPRTR